MKRQLPALLLLIVPLICQAATDRTPPTTEVPRGAAEA